MFKNGGMFFCTFFYANSFGHLKNWWKTDEIKKFKKKIFECSLKNLEFSSFPLDKIMEFKVLGKRNTYVISL